MYMEEIHRYQKHGVAHIVGVDIKAAGSQLCWPAVSVGFCHATYDLVTRVLTFVELKRFDIKVDLDQFEPKCYEELWKYRLDTYNFMQETAQPYDQAAHHITHYLQELLNEHPDIIIISDNIAFDMYRLNAILESQGKDPISDRPNQTHQAPVDISELERTLAIVRSAQDGWQRHIKSSLFSSFTDSCPIKNDHHLPEQTAAEICWKYTHFIEELQKYKR